MPFQAPEFSNQVIQGGKASVVCCYDIEGVVFPTKSGRCLRAGADAAARLHEDVQIERTVLARPSCDIKVYHVLKAHCADKEDRSMSN